MGALGLSPLGVQAVATVDAIGPEVVGFAAGDRVAMRVPGVRPGFQRIVSERDLIGIPKDVSFDDAAAVLAAGLVSRAIVKQLHTVGRGDRVVVNPDVTGTHAFVTAWARHLGATIVGSDERRGDEIVIGEADYKAGLTWRYGHGLAQLAAADVFRAMREGAFDGLPVTTRPLSDAARVHSEIEGGLLFGPVVLLPGRADIAA
jgi:hypothetical protein